MKMTLLMRNSDKSVIAHKTQRFENKQYENTVYYFGGIIVAYADW